MYRDLSPRTRHGRPLSLAESLEMGKELADCLVAKEHSCDGRCGEWERAPSVGHRKVKEIAEAFSFVGDPHSGSTFQHLFHFDLNLLNPGGAGSVCTGFLRALVNFAIAPLRVLPASC